MEPGSVRRAAGSTQPAPYERRRSAGALATQIGATLWAYIWGQVVISIILTALYGAGFALLGVPLWFLLAPLCGFLNLIPRFGAVIALLIGLAAAALGGIGLVRTGGVLGVFVISFVVEGYWLTPRILGRRLRLRPLYVFLAVLAGGALFGFFGLLLAVPALAVAAVVYRFFVTPDSSSRNSTSGV